MTRNAPRTVWLLGLLLGALVGFLGFELPSLGIALFVAAAIGFSRVASRAAGLGGLLLGAGSLWIFVLAQAQARCSAFNAVPNQGCVAPDTTPILLLAAITAVIGIGLTLTAARGRR